MVFPVYPLKIVSGQVMAAIDRTAIEERGMAGLFLMENAGRGVVERLLTHFPPQKLRRTAILCGKGNNGGDGFVIARHLQQLGYSPQVALLGQKDDLQGDAKRSFTLAQEADVPIFECTEPEDLQIFVKLAKDAQIWLDALLGTGSQGAPRGMIQYAIRTLSSLSGEKTIVSIDIPSGVGAVTGKVEGDAVKADLVITLGLPKIGHVLPPGLDSSQRLEILDIGFPHDLLETAESEAELLTETIINQWLPVRDLSAHKGSEGHLLLIAGSRNMTGAALMSAQGAVNMGVGKLTALCPQSLLPVYASHVWEKLTIPVAETSEGSFSASALDGLLPEMGDFSAVVIGPGLGRDPSTQNLVRRVVHEVEAPLLIDGDGLFALNVQDLETRAFPWVVTPHPAEMARFFEKKASDVQADRWGYAKKLAVGSKGVVVLKGAKTVIAAHGHSHQEHPLYVNPTGGPYMASGGMGDILSGMIGALLAKGLSPLRAAVVGVYLHGLAADLFARETGAEAISATQVAANIQNAVSRIRQKKI